jgi:hypothetical protein
LRNYTATILFTLVTLLSANPVNAQAPASPKGPQFVQIAPCLLFDTLTQAADNATEETLRHVNVQVHSCGRVIPRYATRYSLSIVTYSRMAPEKVSAGAGPQVRSIDTPAPADGVLQFPVPNGSHIAVIIDGYWVAPGTPTLPSVSSTAGPAPEAMSTLHPEGLMTRPGSPSAQSLHGSAGTAGDIYLDGLAPYPGVDYAHAGVALIAQAATPNIIVTLGNDNSQNPTFFGIYNTRRNASGIATDSSQLMYVTADAMVRLPGFALFSGRTSYRESPAVPYNFVHDVSIINPRDAAGGATNRVTFFRSESEFDMGSPATTKYMAYSRGDSSQANINFDSQIVLHNGAQYYYRAFSVADTPGVGKDTFWIKAATNGDTITNTRADMYVSGNVGIGTPSPTKKLQVAGSMSLNNDSSTTALNNTYFLYDGGANGWGAYSYGMTMGYQNNRYRTMLFAPDGADVAIATHASGTAPTSQASFSERLTVQGSTGNVGIGTPSPAFGARLDVQGGNLNVGGNISATGSLSATVSISTPGTITAAGSITGGTIHASYQDVAEWVPATHSMTPGTVVVLNPRHGSEVMPSGSAYDTSVAGVVSAQPGLILGERSSTKEMIATTGRVKVRVDARTHPVRVGDLLVTSDVPGTAMRSEPIDVAGIKLHRPGTLIGKALEPLAAGTGEILVLLSLQ